MAEQEVFKLSTDNVPKTMVVLTGEMSSYLEQFLSLIPTKTTILSGPTLIPIDKPHLKKFHELDEIGQQIRLDQHFTKALNSGSKLVIINVPMLKESDSLMYRRLAKANNFMFLKLSGEIDVSNETKEDIQESSADLFKLIFPVQTAGAAVVNFSENQDVGPSFFSGPWWKKNWPSVYSFFGGK